MVAFFGRVYRGTSKSETIKVKSSESIVYGKGGNDRLLGGRGRDRMLGGSGHDILIGGSGSDYLLGDGGNDRLSGGKGSDRLRGGAGRDTLQGGAGGDTFVLSHKSRQRSKVDVIRDFSASQGDKLYISRPTSFGVEKEDLIYDRSRGVLGIGTRKANGMEIIQEYVAVFEKKPAHINVGRDVVIY